MSTDGITFVKNMFWRYYQTKPIDIKDVDKHEIAMFTFKSSSMVRHIGFKSMVDFYRYIIANVPLHLYYSVSEYENPTANIMSNKKRIRTKLVFDIDADHIASEVTSYSEQLDIAKRKTRYLIKILLDDFGFNPDNITIVFSGGRGYHVYVNDASVYKLDVEHRKELVDYLTLKVPEVFIKTGKEVHNIYDTITNRYIGFVEKNTLRLHTKSPMQKRFTNAVIDKLKDWKQMKKKSVIDEMLKYEKDARKCERLYKRLISGGYDQLITNHIYTAGDITPLKDMQKILYEIGIREVSTMIDEPVTVDLHRVIRIPMSIHGKTGMIAQILNIDTLDEFNPFTDAIPSVFNGEVVMTVNAGADIDITLDKKYTIKANSQTKIPINVAIYIIQKQLGKDINIRSVYTR